jgi:membrane protein
MQVNPVSCARTTLSEVDIDSVRSRVQRVRAWALEMLDVVPGLRRLVNELVRVEIIDRAMVIAAQGLLALVPLLIVLAAVLPADLGNFVLERFDHVTGVGSAQTAAAHTTLTTHQVRAQTGAIGVLITLFSATSFARSIQRMYEKVWGRRHIGGIPGARRCFLWLAGWLVLLQIVAYVGGHTGGGTEGSTLRVLVQLIAGTLLWWWTAWALLLGRESWRRLLPGAILTAAVTSMYARASTLVMPHYVENNAQQLGTLGLVLAATTWLIGFAFVMVVCAVVGRVLVEDERIRGLLFTSRSPGQEGVRGARPGEGPAGHTPEPPG